MVGFGVEFGPELDDCILRLLSWSDDIGLSELSEFSPRATGPFGLPTPRAVRLAVTFTPKLILCSWSSQRRTTVNAFQRSTCQRWRTKLKINRWRFARCCSRVIGPDHPGSQHDMFAMLANITNHGGACETKWNCLLVEWRAIRKKNSWKTIKRIARSAICWVREANVLPTD